MSLAVTPVALVDYLRTAIDGVQAERWVVAFSGGLDSTVLLHALVQALAQRQSQSQPQSQSVLAVHVHHGLSVYAEQWAVHCQHVCAELNVPLQICRVEVATDAGRGLEDAARKARYQAFESLVQAGDILLLAHHRDDQAETLLLRLMRGAGPKGLAAMAAERPLGAGRLWRPLLGLARAELQAYADSCQLRWIEDDSNSDERLDRNYLRRQVLPLLEARWPEFSRQWLASAELCRSQEELTRTLVSGDLAALDITSDRAGASLSWSRLQALSQSHRQLLLRLWCEQLRVPTPSRAQLAQIESQLMDRRQDSEAEVRWGGMSLRYYRERLYLLRTPASLVSLDADWELSVTGMAAPLTLPDGGILRAEMATAGAGLAAGHTYQLRYRRGGERCRPLGRAHSQSLKKLLQEYALPPWLRDRVPLLYRDEQLAAVGDLWVCADFAVASGGVRLIWDAPLSMATGMTADPRY